MIRLEAPRPGHVRPATARHHSEPARPVPLGSRVHHAAERRPPSRDRSLLTTHMLVPFGPVCQRCESTDADSLKTIVLQQQDDALLDLVGLCRVWRVTQSSRGCASWLGVRALSSSPTPLARYRTCVQVWRRCLILGEVSVQCSRWLIAKKGVRIFAHRTSSLLC